MKKIRRILPALIFLAAAAALCIGIHTLSSPEYALAKIFRDVKKSGIEGLYPHVTEETKKTLEAITSINDNKFLGTILTYLDKKGDIDRLKSELKQIRWGKKDILKSKNSASVILSFNYKDEVSGAVEVSMLREKRVWKISGFQLSSLHFNGFSEQKEREKASSGEAKSRPR